MQQVVLLLPVLNQRKSGSGVLEDLVAQSAAGLVVMVTARMAQDGFHLQ